MHRTIIVGSPRENGRCASLASQIFDACIEECPDDGISVVSVSGMEIAGCIGCDRCKKSSSCTPLSEQTDGDTEVFELEASKSVRTSDAHTHRCFMNDDIRVVREHMDAADELIVISPVYFASVPAQLKALMDRLQPYYWSDLRNQLKRPMTLHVVGEGGDPHGFDPLVGSVRSAFSVAGFKLDRLLDWVGCITPQGEIMLDAEEISIDG